MPIRSGKPAHDHGYGVRNSGARSTRIWQNRTETREAWRFNSRLYYRCVDVSEEPTVSVELNSTRPSAAIPDGDMRPFERPQGGMEDFVENGWIKSFRSSTNYARQRVQG